MADAKEKTIDEIWNEIYAITGRSFTKAIYSHCPDNQARIEATSKFIKVVYSIRPYAITHLDDITLVWNKLREDNNSIDILMETTSLVFMHCPLTQARIIEELADSFFSFNSLLKYDSPFIKELTAFSKKGYDIQMVMDNEFMASLGKRETMKVFLFNNPWFAILLLLYRSRVLDVVNTQETNDIQNPI